MLPSEIAIGSSNCYPESVTNVALFFKKGNWHRIVTKKFDENKVITHNVERKAEYPNNLASLVDEG